VATQYPTESLAPGVTEGLRQHFRADEIEAHGEDVESYF
jgi:hypothetical protein